MNANRSSRPRRIVPSGGLLVGWAVLGVFGAVGCAKSPTVLLTHVLADDTVPAVLVLRTLVVSDADPSRQSTGSFLSLAAGDAGRPGPYRFPWDLSVSVPSALAGAVTITVEGLDWDTSRVIARGIGTAEVVKEQQRPVTVTLTAVMSPAGDGGDADGGTDATAGDSDAGSGPGDVDAEADATALPGGG